MAASGEWAGYVDGFMINFAREEMGMPFTIVIGNEYIQLEEEDRILRIRRRTPNCTICTVKDLNAIKNVMFEAGVEFDNVTFGSTEEIINALGEWFKRHNSDILSYSLLSQN